MVPAEARGGVIHSPDAAESEPLHIAVLSLATPEHLFLLRLPPEDGTHASRRFDMISTIVSPDLPFRDQLKAYLKEHEFPVTIDEGWLGTCQRVRVGEDGEIQEARRLIFSATVTSGDVLDRLLAHGFHGFQVEGVRAVPVDLFRRPVYKAAILRHDMLLTAREHNTRLMTNPLRVLDIDPHDKRLAELRKHPWYYPIPYIHGTKK